MLKGVASGILFASNFALLLWLDSILGSDSPIMPLVVFNTIGISALIIYESFNSIKN